MGHMRLTAAAVMVVFLASIASAWFGEQAAKKEKAQLEFRETFILVVNCFLYGTVYGEKVSEGLFDAYDGLEALVLMNPPVKHRTIHNLLRHFIIILQPIYLTAILATGGYLLLMSGSPKGRRRAKRLFPRLVASMVAVNFSVAMLDILFTVSQDVSKSIMESSGVALQKVYVETLDELVGFFSLSTLTSFDAGLFFLLLVLALVSGMFMMLALRYMLLLLFTITFPVGIFLYTFGAGRAVGRLMIEQTIIWTLAQVLITTIMVVISLGTGLFGVTGDLKTVLGVTSFIAVIISPVLLIATVRRFLP